MGKRLKVLLFAGCALFLGNVAFARGTLPFQADIHVGADTDFPDPGIVRGRDGFYYAYATQGFTEGDSPTIQNIQVLRSKDLENWTRLPDALPKKPAWASKTQRFWAPDVSVHRLRSGEHRYFMYFSALPDSASGFCIGVAVSEKPQGPFVDKGEPLVCGSGFSNIDPMAFDDPISGASYLIWGSGFQPIRGQELSESRLDFAEGSAPKDLVLPETTGSGSEFGRLIEGAWMTFHDGQYYLFFSGDNCCDPDPHYAVMVARGSFPLGPFSQAPEPVLSQQGSLSRQVSGPRMIAAGHCAVIQDRAGNFRMFYHSIDREHPWLDAKSVIPGDRKVRRIFSWSPLFFDGGWPKIPEIPLVNF
jgi:arabinan endo-1,5-alpha-L-arabinosidase